jgi:hypothetical protein
VLEEIKEQLEDENNDDSTKRIEIMNTKTAYIIA